MKPKKKVKKRNLVAKYMNYAYNTEVHRDKRKYNRAKEKSMARLQISTD